MNRSLLARRLAAALIAAAALTTAFAATHGRQLAQAIEADAVHLGEYGSGLPDVGDADAFEPFSFATIGPVRGSHAALDRAFDELEDVEGLQLVVLLGDVLDGTSRGDVLTMAAALRGRGVDVLAVPGEGDVREETIGAFQRHVSAPDWSFLLRECVFTAWGPGSQGDAERIPIESPIARFLYTTTPDTAPVLDGAHTFSPRGVSDREVAVDVVRVDRGGALNHRTATVSRGSTVGSLFREVELRALYPITRSGWRLAALLAACGACMLGSLRLLRR